MDGSILFIPLAEDGIFLNDPDIHYMTSHALSENISMLQQSLAYSTMSVLR